MNKEFISYELALELKQLGFDEICFGYWYTEQEEFKKIDIQLSSIGFLEGEPDYILAPTFSQCFRWFREKHKLNGEVNYLPNVEKYGIITSDMAGMKPKDLSKKENFEISKKVTNNFVKYDTYEEAELECLKKLIQIVKEKNES
jgi:hypothetical protein